VGSDAVKAKPDGRLVSRSHTCDLLLIVVHILLVGLKHGQVARMSCVFECTDD